MDEILWLTIMTRTSNMPLVASSGPTFDPRGDSFQFGPYGLELISCLVSIGLGPQIGRELGGTAIKYRWEWRYGLISDTPGFITLVRLLWTMATGDYLKILGIPLRNFNGFSSGSLSGSVGIWGIQTPLSVMPILTVNGDPSPLPNWALAFYLPVCQVMLLYFLNWWDSFHVFHVFYCQIVSPSQKNMCQKKSLRHAHHHHDVQSISHDFPMMSAVFSWFSHVFLPFPTTLGA